MKSIPMTTDEKILPHWQKEEMTLKLYWKKLKHNAMAPTCANPGEDLAYDLYACERVTLTSGRTTLVSTGVAIEFDPPHGAIIKDRSSMALKGVKTAAGVIDAGYRGEVNVLMKLDMAPDAANDNDWPFAA